MRSALIWLRLNAVMKQRIPTLLGLAVLIVGVVAGVLLVGEGTGGFLPRANEESIPQQVRITNISDTSFSVSFITQTPSLGLLEYGSAARDLDEQVLDDRDQLSGESGSYRTHHITVRGLQPATQYYFRIGTARRTFFDNQGSPFSVRTSRPGLSPSSAQSASGQVQNQAGSPANGALVYLTTNGASPLSAYIKQDGSWSLPLSQMRTQDLSAIMTMTDSTPLKLQVIGTDGETLNAEVTYGQVAQLRSLQFGQDTTNLSQGSKTPDQQLPDETGSDLAQPDDTTGDNLADEPDSGAPTGGSNQLGSLFDENDRFGTMPQSDITIVYPSEDAEVVSATQPELSGKAPPQSTLQIEVHSDNVFYDVVETDADGNWSWSPPSDLEPGEHTMTLRYTDDTGEQQVVTRTFIVQADTGFPAFVSTPSGQLTSPTPTPVASPTPLPTPSPSPSPSPKPSPSPTLVSYPATYAAQPVTASTGPLWLMAAGAFLFGGLGSVWWIMKPMKAGRYG